MSKSLYLLFTLFIPGFYSYKFFDMIMNHTLINNDEFCQSSNSVNFYFLLATKFYDIISNIEDEDFSMIDALDTTNSSNDDDDVYFDSKGLASIFLNDTDCSKICCKCVVRSSNWIINHFFDSLVSYCSKNHTCPLIIHLCEMALTYKNVTVGMIARQVRSIHTGFAFCIGGGNCSMTDRLRSYEFDWKIFSLSREKSFNDGTQVPRFASDILNNSFNSIKIDTIGQLQTLTSLSSFNSSLFKDPNDKVNERVYMSNIVNSSLEDNNKCKCMKKIINKVINYSFENIDSICSTTTCDKMKLICIWIQSNLHNFFGIFLTEVQPWKFAIGHCLIQDDNDDKYEMSFDKNNDSSLDDVDTLYYIPSIFTNIYSSSFEFNSIESYEDDQEFDSYLRPRKYSIRNKQEEESSTPMFELINKWVNNWIKVLTGC